MISWGRMEKTYRGGTKVRIQRAACDVTVVEAPQLRIIDDDLWKRVQERERKRAHKTGWKHRGPKPRYLLSGLARRETCGGPMHVANAKVSYDNVRVYVCAWHRDRGDAVCSNGLRRPVEGIDGVVLQYLQAQVLREDLVLAVLQDIRQRIAQRAASAETDLPALQAEARKLATEIERLALAIAESETKPAALVKAIDARQQRLDAVEARMRAVRAAPDAIDLELRRMEKTARECLAAFGELLDRSPDEGRKVVEALLHGPSRSRRSRRRRESGSKSPARSAWKPCSVPGASPAGRREALREVP